MIDSNAETRQVAVITGAGRGIGRAIALGYAKAGMAVVCSARSTSEIAATAEKINAEGGAALAVACDVTKAEDITALLAQSEAHFGGIDIIVVNAGMAGERAPIADADTALWRQVIELNLLAAMEQSHQAIPYLRTRGGGKIIFIGSGVARNATPGTSAYGCSKAALAMLNRVLAQELRPDKIAVHELIPGPVRTALTGVPEEHAGRDGEASPILTIPGEWTKDPQDVVPLALFLAQLPNDGPSGQSYSLTARDLGRI
jgi:3-oxoacyl-[acyl-carrier protein] reductase